MFRQTISALAIAGACSLPAYAHVTASPDAGAAGSHFQTSFTVPHGCDGSPTIALRVHIPEGVYSVKPQFKPGWTVTTSTRKLKVPVKAPHGKGDITETIDTVEWRGGPLPDALYDSFGLIVKLPDTPGVTLYFPATQVCEKGRVEWNGHVPAGHAHHQGADTHPVPTVRILPRTP